MQFISIVLICNCVWGWGYQGAGACPACLPTRYLPGPAGTEAVAIFILTRRVTWTSIQCINNKWALPQYNPIKLLQCCNVLSSSLLYASIQYVHWKALSRVYQALDMQHPLMACQSTHPVWPVSDITIEALVTVIDLFFLRTLTPSPLRCCIANLHCIATPLERRHDTDTGLTSHQPASLTRIPIQRSNKESPAE